MRGFIASPTSLVFQFQIKIEVVAATLSVCDTGRFHFSINNKNNAGYSEDVRILERIAASYISLWNLAFFVKATKFSNLQ